MKNKTKTEKVRPTARNVRKGDLLVELAEQGSYVYEPEIYISLIVAVTEHGVIAWRLHREDSLNYSQVELYELPFRQALILTKSGTYLIGQKSAYKGTGEPDQNDKPKRTKR